MALSSVQRVLVLAICFSIGACAFKKEDSEQTKREKLANEVANQFKGKEGLHQTNVKWNFEELEVGYYNLVLQWPESIGAVEVFIDNELVTRVSDRNYFKWKTNQGETVSYKLRAYASQDKLGAFINEFEDSQKAPSDMILSTNITLTSNRIFDVNRAYFGADKRISTNGYNLTIRAQKLFVEENESYDTGNKLQKSQIVSNSNEQNSINIRESNIQIIAKVATGTLRIAMIGKNGADGNDAPPLSINRAANGASGTPGSGSLGKSCPSARNADSGCTFSPPKCLKAPSNGQNGQDGINGLNGSDGANGGGTGNLKVEVSDDSNFALEVYRKPGKGGRGGKGSQGQLGGFGGAPGKDAPGCTRASAGKNGKDGETGNNGIDGADGAFGVIDTNVSKLTKDSEI